MIGVYMLANILRVLEIAREELCLLANSQRRLKELRVRVRVRRRQKTCIRQKGESLTLFTRISHEVE
jgi:hypothetical protein